MMRERACAVLIKAVFKLKIMSNDNLQGYDCSQKDEKRPPVLNFFIAQVFCTGVSPYLLSINSLKCSAWHYVVCLFLAPHLGYDLRFGKLHFLLQYDIRMLPILLLASLLTIRVAANRVQPHSIGGR